MTQEFIILPAIDLLDGKSVRLVQGARPSATEVHSDALRQLQEYADAGAKWVHVVDLNAAFGDAPDSFGRKSTAQRLGRIISETGLKIELGGGIRSRMDAVRLLDLGVSRVIVGTWATTHTEDCMALAREFPGQVVVGLDTLADKVAIRGWTEASSLNVQEFAAHLFAGGVRYALYTQVERDGLLSGVDERAAAQLYEASQLKIIASGGVRDAKDIERLSQTAGVAGVVIGKALAVGSLKLTDALAFQRLGIL